jgi:osmoprotectant transport system permease protein
MRLFTFWASHRAEFLELVGQHVLLVVLSTAAAVAIGVPLGVLAHRRPRLGAPLVAIANVAQTVPSLAMFGFLIPLPFIGGVGVRTALVVLVAYALLPVIRTTAAGLGGVDRAIGEAALAMGMTPRQRLFLVELPLALPTIVAGIRVATVIGVGTATIAAAVGAGGLGDYIFRGLSMVDSTVILAGAIPAAVLALVADGSLTLVERWLRPGRRRRPARARAAGVAAMLLVAAAVVGFAAGDRDRIRVGSKNFTEQLILGELVAQAIERYAGLPVDRQLNLGGTFICDRALRSGEIDAYVEYTGTALTAIFHRRLEADAARVFEQVRQDYAETARTLGQPLGFNNTYAILIRGADARAHGLRTITDATRLTPRWRAGFGFEFLERQDGYAGLARTYGLEFAAPPGVMDLALMYRALANGQVDLIAGDATNGLIAGLDLFHLRDDRGYFPPYDAVPVFRTQTLLRHPEIGRAVGRLAGRISEDTMRALNHAVDVERRDVSVVARELLERIDRDSRRSKVEG